MQRKKLFTKKCEHFRSYFANYFAKMNDSKNVKDEAYFFSENFAKINIIVVEAVLCLFMMNFCKNFAFFN